MEDRGGTANIFGRPWTFIRGVPDMRHLPPEEALDCFRRLGGADFHAFYNAPAVVVIAAPVSSPWAVEDACLSAQNLMLAARALGYGCVPTTLHPTVMDRFYEMFDIPKNIVFHFCIPMGKPRGRFGPTSRIPTEKTSYYNGWGAKVPWAGAGD